MIDRIMLACPAPFFTRKTTQAEIIIYRVNQLNHSSEQSDNFQGLSWFLILRSMLVKSPVSVVLHKAGCLKSLIMIFIIFSLITYGVIKIKLLFCFTNICVSIWNTPKIRLFLWNTLLFHLKQQSVSKRICGYILICDFKFRIHGYVCLRFSEVLKYNIL